MITFNLNDKIISPKGHNITILSEQEDRYEILIGEVVEGFLYRKDGAIFDKFSLYWDRLDVPEAVEKKQACDCGGFKTYNSYDVAFHSRWCEVHK